MLGLVATSQWMEFWWPLQFSLWWHVFCHLLCIWLWHPRNLLCAWANLIIFGFLSAFTFGLVGVSFNGTLSICDGGFEIWFFLNLDGWGCHFLSHDCGHSIFSNSMPVFVPVFWRADDFIVQMVEYNGECSHNVEWFLFC